ncbi:nucleotidyl transferase AbiEii/AbiGii toxin family protein [Ramlibacter sp. 2FC]|uniref:nucleotidyl transferase AbiEii/AbiGii toxin family protein n=1 Tax=Ramlibacter sp. 2FC TaxID=2502188 RepID=UPI0010FA0443|nr:nucleotidyl transferase AbiEii/AbiGii toxin family protein [Ramlibacter sp. 2FC]
MDKAYADTVRLLLTAAPDVFANDIFAMKGGTAINLFVQDMPRLSVDIDVVYTPWQTPREQALKAISNELDAIAGRLVQLGLTTRKVSSKELGDTKLLIENAEAQVKVEVNVVFRGTVLPVERYPLSPKTAGLFSMALELPVLAPAELYGSKLVAAMDRQHPRDLFDVLQMFESGDLSDAAVECFVTYLAGHNRPTHEVLFGNEKDIAHEYHQNFAGMTIEPVGLDALLETRARLREELPQRLTANQRQFLVGLVRAQPDWTLLQCPHAFELPALRWKVGNLQTFSQRRPADFKKQAAALEDFLA